MGAELPLVLERMEGDEPDAGRPQDPVEPYPYVAEDVRYPNPDGGHELAGTFTRPSDGGPFPAVILITGSGPQNRDEALMGHRPFFVLSDHLTRRGIAVLRFDDRGVGRVYRRPRCRHLKRLRVGRPCRRRLPEDPRRCGPWRDRPRGPLRGRPDRPHRRHPVRRRQLHRADGGDGRDRRADPCTRRAPSSTGRPVPRRSRSKGIRSCSARCSTSSSPSRTRSARPPR